ncbi:MAG: hypothetical protein JWO93_2821 [Micrococcaceae bacterium]|nr:hypothetical protein [Micrococcaceae bacterium]
MIRRQTVQWILLPGGLTADGQLAASVFIAPRLRPDGQATLADFPDFADWPQTLAGLDLRIVRPDGETEAPLTVAMSAESAYWTSIFTSDTAVRPFRFDDLADRPLISYPVAEVLAHLRNRWATLAFQARDDLPITSRNAAPIGPPPDGPGDQRRFNLVDHFSELRQVLFRGLYEGVSDSTEFSGRLRGVLDGASAEARVLRAAHHSTMQPLIRPFGAGGTPTDAFASLAGFHARPSAEQPREFPGSRDQVRDQLAQAHDFHHLLSVLGDHPALMGALGLVLDLTIRPDFVPVTAEADPPVPLRLQVQRASAFPARRNDPGADVWNVDATPATWCRLTNVGGQSVFSAVERSGRADFVHGFLHLDPARYAAVGVDVDGLALKALNLATTLQRQNDREQRPVEEPSREGVPTARTGGIALVHSNSAEDLHEGFYAARAADDSLEADPESPSDLAAEDLVRGYRLDIQAEGTWRSLHRRRVAYSALRYPDRPLEVEDEGQVELSLTSEADRPDAPADPDRPLYSHEVLTTWDGWSLAGPRPGQGIPQEPPTADAAADLTSMQLDITADVAPGTLPRLRFGSGYRARVRTVDLAGRAHTVENADHLLAVFEGNGDPRYTVATPAEPLTYRRFEPVPPPELVPRWVFGPGEGAERLVIRSTPGMSVSDYAAASQGASQENLRYHDSAQRHLLAAKASLALIEAHGLLDDAITAVKGRDPEAAAAAAQEWYDVAARESGTVLALPGARFVVTGTHRPEVAPGGNDDGNRPAEEQGYACLDADVIDLPYLPDPLGVGARLRFQFDPAEPAQVLELRYPDGGAWYSPRPLRLLLQEGQPGADFDPGSAVLTVRVRPGRTATLRLSSLFQGDPDLLGVVDWCRQELPADRYDAVVDAVVRSAHWMTTPWRDLLLVHATQRPLAVPELDLDTDDVAGFAGARVLARNIGETTLHLHGRLFADLPSTGQVDLQGHWADTIDDPAQRYDEVEDMTSGVGRQVFSIPVPEPFGTPWQPEIASLTEPLDGKGLTFHTRGREAETPAKVRARLLQDAKAAGLGTPERRRLEAAAAQIEQLRSHEFGDTRYRRVDYTPVAATRFREYFDPLMPTGDGNSVGPTVTVDVLSCAAPAKPTVLQLLPLLSYEQRTQDATTTSRRAGLGLRVWLGRPWFSSGAGELLAVVCDRGGPLTESSELSRDITLITGDPAHGSALPLPLRTGSFPDAEVVRSDVTLAGGGPRRDIACFTPRWDAGRQAWYVDLRFGTGDAYFPFVRLGLARYQPASVPGYELSPMVSTAFVQTLPDRSLTCTHGDGNVEVSLTGPAPTAAMDVTGTVRPGSNEVVAVVEVQPETYPDPLLGWSPLGGETALVVQPGAGTTATYSATVQTSAAPGQRRRLVVREYESHPADDRSQAPASALVATRRLVHADVVLLDP